MVTGLGLGCNVDTGVHQVSDVLGLDLLPWELFPLKVDRASNRQLGNGTDQLGDFGGNEWGVGCFSKDTLKKNKKNQSSTLLGGT